MVREMGYFENSPLGTECDVFVNPPASEASREVANLTERKNQHTAVYSVKEFVCLSVCPSVTKFDPNHLRTIKTEWAEKKLRTSMA